MRSSACAWPRRRRPRGSTRFCTTKKAITYSAMERREFVQFCLATAATAASPAVAADAEPRRYARSRLVDAHGAPLHAADVPANRNLIFHYPYAATPCFLLNLGRPTAPTVLKTADDHPYTWQGGVGAGHSIVAYSAICAHKLTYPTPEISFISYRTEKTPANRFSSVIHCCSEHSQYDPAAGARVVAGPAPRPATCRWRACCRLTGTASSRGIRRPSRSSGGRPTRVWCCIAMSSRWRARSPKACATRATRCVSTRRSSACSPAAPIARKAL